MKGRVFSVNQSQAKGVPKLPVKEGYLKEGWGLLGDAHSGRWHRQVSLLPWESIKSQNACPKIKKSKDEGFKPGDFAENITTEGLDLAKLRVGDQIEIGEDIKVKVTQIGKKCHTRCAIYEKVGKCIMPKEGIFAEVLKGGRVKAGDKIKIWGEMMKIGIITVSDRCSEGKQEDKSGPLIRQMVENLGKVIKYEVIPDEKATISRAIKEAVDQLKADLVLTTGGTGVSFRDVTPEATREVVEKEIPGFGELMRQESFKITPMAILSRATAGTRGKSLIINLPGSLKAVKECLEIILSLIPHALDMIKGKGHEKCAVLQRS